MPLPLFGDLFESAARIVDEYDTEINNCGRNEPASNDSSAMNMDSPDSMLPSDSLADETADDDLFSDTVAEAVEDLHESRFQLWVGEPGCGQSVLSRALEIPNSNANETPIQNIDTPHWR